MEDKKTAKTLWNNVRFFQTNIITLLKLRPQISVVIQRADENGVAFCQKDNSGNKETSLEEHWENYEKLGAINSSLVLSCYSLFEASFECLLLSELSTQNLTGIQEKVMEKYIENVIKLSNYNNYIKEYNFITGKKFKDLFNEEELEHQKVIEKFYTLRHILIHGSALKSIMVEKTMGSAQLELDTADMEYQNLIDFIKSKLQIQIPNKRFTFEFVMYMNEITDLLIEATFKITAKMYNSNQMPVTFIKENVFTQVKRTKQEL